MADAFISHASEDKHEIARPLAQELMARGFSVWFDEYTLRLGDGYAVEIDRGLASCHLGIVILSPAFLVKKWPKRELDGLITREENERNNRILPVWHNVCADLVTQFSPMLASRLAVSTDRGVSVVADSVERVLTEYMGRALNQNESRTARTLILESWLKIERAIEALADRYGCFGSPNSYMAHQVNELGVFNDVLLTLYEDLSSFRNRAVEASDFLLTPDEIEHFRARASSLVIALRQLISS